MDKPLIIPSHIRMTGEPMRIVVIGGGPAGRTGAIEAAQLGEEVTLIEKENLGGKCLNEGCMVVSGLNDVAKFYKDAKNFHQLGITDKINDINFQKVAKGVKETIAKIRGVHESETREAGVEVVKGTAQMGNGSITVNGEIYPYHKLIVATGSRPYIPPIKGAENAKTYEDVLKFEEVPDKLLIVGSGVIAAEFASIFSLMGAEVEILCRNLFLKMLDDDIKNYVVKKLLNEVKIHENIQVKEIKSEGLLTDGGPIEGEVLLATGLTPNSQILEGKVDIGSRKEVIVNKKMETSERNIYAAGDLVGGIANTPVARMEGIVAARNACGIYTEADYRLIPSSISLYYDVAYLTNKKDMETVEAIIPGFAGPGSFWNVLNRNTGITKVKVHPDTGDIQDITSISPSARTSMAYLSKMMKEKYKTYDFDDFMETHPSTDAVYKLLRFFAKYG